MPIRAAQRLTVNNSQLTLFFFRQFGECLYRTHQIASDNRIGKHARNAAGHRKDPVGYFHLRGR